MVATSQDIGLKQHASSFGNSARSVAGGFPAAPLSPRLARDALTIMDARDADEAVTVHNRLLAIDATVFEVRSLPHRRSIRSDLIERVRAIWASEPRREVQQSGLFLDDWYAARYPESGGAAHALAFFMRRGIEAEHQPNPFFDPAWYRATYRLDDNRIPAIIHYLRIGARHGLAPSPLFDPVAYMRDNPDSAAEPDLLAHFLRSCVHQRNVVTRLEKMQSATAP